MLHAGRMVSNTTARERFGSRRRNGGGTWRLQHADIIIVVGGEVYHCNDLCHAGEQ